MSDDQAVPELSVADWLSGKPYIRPETPGYHGVHLGGLLDGFRLSMCVKCGSLLTDDDQVRQVHTQWHDGIQALSRWALDQPSNPEHEAWVAMRNQQKP